MSDSCRAGYHVCLAAQRCACSCHRALDLRHAYQLASDARFHGWHPRLLEAVALRPTISGHEVYAWQVQLAHRDDTGAFRVQVRVHCRADLERLLRTPLTRVLTLPREVWRWPPVAAVDDDTA